MKEALQRAISSYAEAMARFTQELVRIPTENPPGRHYRRCIERVGAEIQRLGLEPTIEPVSQPGVSPTSEQVPASEPRYWLQSVYGTSGPVLYFHGHYDVVPAAGRHQFEPRIDRGSLFGRGATDMKGGLTAMIYATKALMDCGISLSGRIGLVVVPDEETGGHRGSAALAEAGLLGVHGIGMLTAEPTGGAIWNAARGAISLRVRVRGRPAHVGLHYRGVNAFERMLEVAEALRELKNEVEKRQTRYRIEPAAARRSILMMGGRVEGGDNFNLVPEECVFTVDRRLNPEEDLGREKEQLLAVLEKMRRRGVELEVEVFQEAAASGCSEDDALARALAESIESVTGRRAHFEMCPGLLEIRFYTELGVPAYAYGPGLLSVAHGPKEFIKLKDIEEAATVYALTAARRLGR